MSNLKGQDTLIVQKMKDFSDLLDQISTLSDKKKTLWREIYTNAIQDRQLAADQVQELSQLIAGSLQNHAINDPNLTKFMERMCKANEVLLKLAELLTREEEKEQKSISKEDLYSQIKS